MTLLFFPALMYSIIILIVSMFPVLSSDMGSLDLLKKHRKEILVALLGVILVLVSVMAPGLLETLVVASLIVTSLALILIIRERRLSKKQVTTGATQATKEASSWFGAFMALAWVMKAKGILAWMGSWIIKIILFTWINDLPIKPWAKKLLKGLLAVGLFVWFFFFTSWGRELTQKAIGLVAGNITLSPPTMTLAEFFALQELLGNVFKYLCIILAVLITLYTIITFAKIVSNKKGQEDQVARTSPKLNIQTTRMQTEEKHSENPNFWRNAFNGLIFLGSIVLLLFLTGFLYQKYETYVTKEESEREKIAAIDHVENAKEAWKEEAAEEVRKARKEANEAYFEKERAEFEIIRVKKADGKDRKKWKPETGKKSRKRRGTWFGKTTSPKEDLMKR